MNVNPLRLENYSVNRNVVSRSIQGEEVIMDLDSGMYFGLNEVGTRLWNSLKTRKSTEQFLEEIDGEFDVERDDVVADLSLMLKTLEKKKLILPA